VNDVMLACGDRAMALHSGEHDGLPNPHPSCVAHAGLHPGACTPVPPPDLTGRLAHCDYYGVERYKSGPIYGGADCSARECFCVVPSSITLPFFSYNDDLKKSRCGVAGVPSTSAFNSRGLCRFYQWQHEERRIPLVARHITVKYKADCHMCHARIKIGSVALYWKDGDRATLYHLKQHCEPRQHDFVPLDVDLGADTFYCGCHGWD
jgi:hypothetical protein